MSCIHNTGKNGIYNESDEFMAGQITHCASGVIPQGWLECNGAAVSRTVYGTLFAAIGTNYGAGDGANTFNLPDLRGEFIRGADRGRGVDPGRAVGSAQKASHHASVMRSSGYGNAAWADGAVIGGNVRGGTVEGFSYENVVGGHLVFDGSTTSAQVVRSDAVSRNVALITIIKYS